ncbi:hypothetical protein C0J52_05926 [Blattella germanica]|nr:hypothetical protein C0J52_05926 [Blattella germanica]
MFIRHLPIVVLKSRSVAITRKELKHKFTTPAQTRHTPQTFKTKLTQQNNKRTPRTTRGRTSFSHSCHLLTNFEDAVCRSNTVSEEIQTITELLNITELLTFALI